MKRRAFLAMLGLAPAVAALPAVANARPLPWEGHVPFPTSDGTLYVNPKYRLIVAANSHGRTGVGLNARRCEGAYRSADLFLDSPAKVGSTRVIIKADRFRIAGVDGDGNVYFQEV